MSSPGSAFLLVSTKNTDFGQIQGRKSANQGLSARVRRFWNLKQQWLSTVTMVNTTNAHKMLTERKADPGDEIVLLLASGLF